MSMAQEAAALRRENQELRALVKSLQARNAQLESQLAKATKNSGNSSKPPSSDIVKPPKPGRSKSRRSIGGQPGHPVTNGPLSRPTKWMSVYSISWRSVQTAAAGIWKLWQNPFKCCNRSN